MTLSQLVEEAKQGNLAAQQGLFNELYDKMWYVCRRYIKDEWDAEEVLQDGFYNFFKGLSTFKYISDEAMWEWIKRIVINNCLMHLRRKKVFNLVTESHAVEIALNEDLLDRLSADEVLEFILLLPTGYRTVFNLYIVEGMKHNEIASLLQIAESSSRSQLLRARNLFQKILLSKGISYDTQRKR